MLSVRPSGRRAFIFRFGNPAMNDPTRVTVAVACRKIRVAGAVLILKPVKTRVVVKPGQTKSGKLACPPQTTSAGAAVDLDPGARSVESFEGAALSLRASTASPSALRFRVANAGARAHEVVVQGSCVTVLLGPRVAQARLRTTISTYTNVIAPGRHHLLHSCRPGWRAVGAGYALTSGSMLIDGAAALDASGSWWARNTGASPLRAQLQLICARLS